MQANSGTAPATVIGSLVVEQPAGLKESKRKMSWARADLHAFQANGCSIGDERRANMHRPGHFAADFL